LRATLITFFILVADGLQINKPTFAAGHGTVVQPAFIIVVFGYKQAQQCSRIH